MEALPAGYPGGTGSKNQHIFGIRRHAPPVTAGGDEGYRGDGASARWLRMNSSMR